MATTDPSISHLAGAVQSSLASYVQKATKPTVAELQFIKDINERSLEYYTGLTNKAKKVDTNVDTIIERFERIQAVLDTIDLISKKVVSLEAAAESLSTYSKELEVAVSATLKL